MADLSQFLNGGGSAGRKVVAIQALNRPTSGGSITPAPDQYACLIWQTQFGQANGTLSIVSGGRTIVNSLNDSFTEKINSDGDGVANQFFLGRKGEVMTYTFSTSNIYIRGIALLMEDM